MAEIIPFPVAAEPAEPEIDLLTAVDAAIRDLRDIARSWDEDCAKQQAEDCRRMLERAFYSALAGQY